MRESRYEHFPHDADVGVRGIGASPAEAFEEAALALTAVITDPVRVDAAERVEIRCEAPDIELLLADFLNAVIYEMATRGMLFGRYEVKIEGASLEAAAFGERVDVEKHRPIVEAKGATLTSLRVEQRADGTWLAQCVVDV
ncbi:MAG: archease [Gammaproteobacteria bacterium]|nr:archease [Gammaproteobacteria bacterium]